MHNASARPIGDIASHADTAQASQQTHSMQVTCSHLHALNVLEPQLMMDDLQILHWVNTVLCMHHICILHVCKAWSITPW